MSCLKEILCCLKNLCDCQNELILVPVFGVFQEQGGGPVTKTPEFYSRTKGRIIAMAEMTDSQQVTLTVDIKDKKGNPAKVESPAWLTDNPNVLALTPSADGLSCLVVAVGPLGTATVTFKADADLGSGVTDIMGTIDFNIIGGQAVVATINAGTPEEQP